MCNKSNLSYIEISYVLHCMAVEVFVSVLNSANDQLLPSHLTVVITTND